MRDVLHHALHTRVRIPGWRSRSLEDLKRSGTVNLDVVPPGGLIRARSVVQTGHTFTTDTNHHGARVATQFVSDDRDGADTDVRIHHEVAVLVDGDRGVPVVDERSDSSPIPTGVEEVDLTVQAK